MRFLKNLFVLVFFILLVSIQTNVISANSDFTITSSLNIYLQNLHDKVVLVEDITEIRATNPNYYIPANSKQIILVKKEGTLKNTIQAVDRTGKSLNFQVQEIDENYQIIILNQQSITTSRPFFAKIIYKTEEYISQNGNIINLYLPGLHKDSVFEKIDPKHNLKTKFEYYLSYHIPKNSPAQSFITPKTITSTVASQYIIYSFPQESRIGNTGWIQLGTEQYYFFQINQKIPKTDFITPEQLSKYTKFVPKNILELALPQEFHENKQQVFFSQISPKPHRIRTDIEGNIIAIFELEANKNHNVVIEGYIKLTKEDIEIPEFTLSQYKNRLTELNRLNIYTQPDKYWESDNILIQEIAEKIFQENQNKPVMSLIRSNYNFVIESLEYSKEKAEGDNIRIGALKALQGGESVCMEYADLLITILRAQGIPTRAAFGYGNDPIRTELDRQVGHQWVQVWYPDYGWLSLDPTWGEINREYIGSDLEHLLWYVVGASEQKITDVAIYSSNLTNTNPLESHIVTIEPLHSSQIPDLSTLPTISDIVLEYKQEEKDNVSQVEDILKTSILGQMFIFVTPVLAILVFITMISILVSKLLKKSKNNQTVSFPRNNL